MILRIVEFWEKERVYVCEEAVTRKTYRLDLDSDGGLPDLTSKDLIGRLVKVDSLTTYIETAHGVKLI